MHPFRPALLALAAAPLLLAACGDTPAAVAPRETAAAATQPSAFPNPLLARGPTATEPVLYRFRSVEDPSTPPDPAVCAAAPFPTNVPLGASLLAETTRASDGRVVNGSVRRIGTATACARITDPTFPPGLKQDFYVHFQMPEGTVRAVGGCTLVSNDVPARGLVLAGCHLRVIGAPAGVVGGSATSLSVFNPRGLPGFGTGSEWTLQLYGE